MSAISGKVLAITGDKDYIDLGVLLDVLLRQTARRRASRAPTGPDGQITAGQRRPGEQRPPAPHQLGP